MKVLITGGNGYIGKSLFLALRQLYDVTSIGRDDVDLTISKDVTKFFEDKYYDVVIHCAIVGGSRLKQDSIDVLDNNLKMYYNLLENRNKYNRFINFGSGAEKYMPDTPYGKSKSIISDSIRYKQNFFNIVVYGVFDENELNTRFIKSNIIRYINGEPMLVDGNKKMSFFYMKDLIKLVTHIIATPSEKLMNVNYAAYIGTPSLLDIANMINSLDAKKVKIYVGIDPVEDYECTYNAGYLLDYIGLVGGIIEVYNKLKCNK
jgi:nucleoside-diphosphate-sugar epimerase